MNPASDGDEVRLGVGVGTEASGPKIVDADGLADRLLSRPFSARGKGIVADILRFFGQRSSFSHWGLTRPFNKSSPLETCRNRLFRSSSRARSFSTRLSLMTQLISSFQETLSARTLA